MEVTSQVFTWSTPHGTCDELMAHCSSSDGFSALVSSTFSHPQQIAERIRTFAMMLPACMRGRWPQLIVSSFTAEELGEDETLAIVFHKPLRLVMYRDAIDSLEVTLAHELAHIVGDEGEAPHNLRRLWKKAVRADALDAHRSDHPILQRMSATPPMLHIVGIYRQLIPERGAVTNYAYGAGAHRDAEEWAESVSLFVTSALNGGLGEFEGEEVTFEDLYPARSGLLTAWAQGRVATGELLAA